jgi:hypothetical protein
MVPGILSVAWGEPKAEKFYFDNSIPIESDRQVNDIKRLLISKEL